jgi:hypothetical protein
VDQGIMSSPNPKSGKVLNEFTAEIVKSFYNSDRASIRVLMSGERITYRLISALSEYMNRNSCCVV